MWGPRMAATTTEMYSNEVKQSSVSMMIAMLYGWQTGNIVYGFTFVGRIVQGQGFRIRNKLFD